MYDWLNDLHLLGQSGGFIYVKFTQSILKAGASMPKLSARIFYSKLGSTIFVSRSLWYNRN
jgi:hypothetical protein